MTYRNPPNTAQTAAEAYALYRDALGRNGLTQSAWHKDADDGRQLAGGLGVLGPEIDWPRDCPAQIMPRWLAQMMPWLFDGQQAEDAFAWGLKFYGELKRLNGVVPFAVVHDWTANVVVLLGIEWRELMGVSTDAAKALQALHVRALNKDVAPRYKWFQALQPALRESYTSAEAYAAACDLAAADAYAYADAYANAYANAFADADAYADADAFANAKKIRYQQAIKRLADGLIECLARVDAPTTINGE